jgi:RimJ/RimL family protein N-acetyltransferase
LKYLFFKRNISPMPDPLERPADLSVELWRPRPAQPLSPVLPVFPFGAWSLLHLLGVFATREYAVLLIRQGGRVVNRLCLFPAYYRFPFMAAGDLQLAGLWTDPEYRGQGLGYLAVQEALRRLANPERVLWYLAREGNTPSIRLAEKARFRLAGFGERQDALGLRVLGRFQMTREAVIPETGGNGAGQPRQQPGPTPEGA